MVSEKVRKIIDDMFEWLMEEGSGISKEDLTEPAIINFVNMYIDDKINKEELIQIGEELDFEIDFEVLDKEKEKKKNKRK